MDTHVSALALPYRTLFHPWGEDDTGLYVEGVLGYGRAKESVADLWGGSLPGLETGVNTTWTTIGGQLGVGPQFALGEDLSLAAIASVGLAHVANDTSYSGPGAALTAALLDGIAFNREGLTGSLGGALRLDGHHQLGSDHRLEYVGRHDALWSSTLQDSDYAQDFTALTQVATLPATWSVRGRLTLQATAIRGQDLTGYTFGLGFSK